MNGTGFWLKIDFSGTQVFGRKHLTGVNHDIKYSLLFSIQPQAIFLQKMAYKVYVCCQVKGVVWQQK